MANLLIDPIVADESSDFVDVVVRLDAAAPSVVTVTYDSSNSTAGGNDYVYPGGTLTFQPGETSKTVRVQLRPDSTVEPPEIFFFTLRSATGATIATPATAITLIDNDTVVATPRLFVDDIDVDEKQGVAQFIVRLGRDLGESSNVPVSVRYTTRDLSAVAGQDYAATSGMLTFEPGQSVKTVSVPLLDDGLAEGIERFELVLGEAVNASIAKGTALAQIALSDGAGSSQPRISMAPVTVGESSGFIDLPVRLHAPSTLPVTVSYDSSNSTAGGNDYVYPGGTLIFQPGETLKTVRIQLRDDTSAEEPEMFFFTLRSAVNATIETPAVPVTVVDNDTVVETPRLFVDDVHVDEKQGTAQFVVRLGRDLGEAANGVVTVAYTTRDGTALAGQDYVARSGTLSFQPGEVTKTVTVDLVDDALAEGIERFELVLGEAVNASIAKGTALAQIALSDGAGSSQPRISMAPVTVGESSGFIDLPVRLHAPSTLPVTVSYDSSNSTAGGNDYVYPGGTLIFQPGETLKTVRIQLRDDTSAEGPEMFFFTLRSAVNATIETPAVPVTVVDNDTVVETPRLFVDDVHVDEKQGTAQFVVRLGRDLGEAANGVVTVAYTTRDGTALAGQDYVARSGTLSFQPGEVTKTVTVDLVDDALAEPAERFGLVLSAPVNAALGDAQAAAQIALSDGPGSSQPRVEASAVTVSEGDRFVDMPVRLHAPTTLPVTVTYDSANSTAGGNDYVYPGGTLIFQPGETLKSVRVQLRDDIASEGTEVFNFVLRSATNATIPQPSVAVTILDNDGPRPLLSQGFGDDVYTIDTTAVDFIEAPDGGFDVVRSSASFTLPAELEGIVLTGSALNATGNDKNNFFSGNASSNTIDGRGGIDTVALAGRDSDYAISGSVASRTVTRAGEGTDTLLSIERLQFANVVQAFDTTPGGNTWGAFALLNAAFNQAPDAALLGQWTAVLDRSNASMDELARQLIQWYAPGVGNEALVVHLWSTVVETPITPADLASFVGLIDNGTLTQASLTVLAATHPLNTDEFAALVGQPMLLDPVWFPLPGA